MKIFDNKNINGKYEPDLTAPPVIEEADNSIIAENYRNFCYAEIDGKIYYRDNNKMLPQLFSEKDTARRARIIMKCSACGWGWTRRKQGR